MRNEIIYTQILIEALKKKENALEHIKEITARQSELLAREELDTEAFDVLIEEKKVYINIIQELDEGFTLTFTHVREELDNNKSQFRQEISQMQELIKRIMSLGMEIEAAEQRNRLAFDRSISRARTDIKAKRVSSQSVSKYYKNAMGSVASQSYYMDEKK